MAMVDGGAGDATGTTPAGLNADCANGACVSGLTAVTYYGFAGDAGPLFCTCTIPCVTNPNACPTGTTCKNIADGPGLVCAVP